MTKLTTLELFKEDMKFSAGHFTIFSATERENLHGHNYNLYVAITTDIKGDGLSFNYRLAKQRLRELCAQVDETLLLPTQSPHLQITEQTTGYQVIFASETLQFLKRDVTLLPVANITVEELSQWFMQQLLQSDLLTLDPGIVALTVKVLSGPGQSGSCEWERT